MALAVAQFSSGSQITGTGVPGQPLLGSNPTVGNLVIIFLHTDSGSTGITIDTSNYQILAANPDPNTFVTNTYALARYVQSGDLALLPAMASAGTCHWAYVAYEVSGVAGTLAADVQTVGGLSFTNVPQGGIFPTKVQQVPLVAGSLALVSGGNYTGSGAPTAASGWTQDVSTGSQTNWGSLGGFSYPNPTAGTPIDGITNNCATVEQVILQPSVPTYPYLRQSFTNQWATGIVTGAQGLLQAPPKPGNLIVAMVQSVGFDIADFTLGTGWTIGATYTDTGDYYSLLLYRYAQIGDTAVLPEFVSLYTGANGAWGYSSFEISGITGEWTNDFQSAQSGRAISVTSITSSDGTTALENTLAIVQGGSFSAFNGSSPSLSGGFTNLESYWDFGTIFAGTQTFADEGSTVSTTLTIPDSGNLTYMQALFGGAPLPPPGVAGAFLLLGVGT